MPLEATAGAIPQSIDDTLRRLLLPLAENHHLGQ
jgi:hypothetical protein